MTRLEVSKKNLRDSGEAVDAIAHELRPLRSARALDLVAEAMPGGTSGDAADKASESLDAQLRADARKVENHGAALKTSAATYTEADHYEEPEWTPPGVEHLFPKHNGYASATGVAGRSNAQVAP